jgi:hypothetical protein
VHRPRARAYAHIQWSAASLVEAVVAIIANSRRIVVFI